MREALRRLAIVLLFLLAATLAGAAIGAYAAISITQSINE